MGRATENGAKQDDGGAPKPPRARRSFTDEYKSGAVRLVLDEGRTVGQVARDLDLTTTALAEWVKRARADRTHGKTGLTTEGARVTNEQMTLAAVRLPVACIALVLTSGCAHPRSVLGTSHGFAAPVEASTGTDGGLVVSIGNAEGDGAVALPSGDLVVAGRDERGFVMRLSPTGDVRWAVAFDRCQGLLLAAANDDAIYVVDRAEGSRYPPGTSCDRSFVGAHGMLYRLDARGAVVWRTAVPFAPSSIIASKERVVGVGLGMFSVTADGRPEWSNDDTAARLGSADWLEPHAIVVSGAPSVQSPGRHDPTTYAPCFLRGVEASSGRTLWEHTVEPRASWCLPYEVSVVGRQAIFRTHVINDGKPIDVYGQMLVTGFDPSDGTVRWQRLDPADLKLSTPFAPLPPVGPAFADHGLAVVDYRLTTPYRYVPLLVAVDPATGHGRPIARLDVDVPGGFGEWLLHVERASVDHGTLLAVGTFYGRLEAAGLRVESPSPQRPACLLCSVEYDQAMFVVRLPVMRGPAR
jgi:transposase-like protein/outer membrane protein assembly factor BamB